MGNNEQVNRDGGQAARPSPAHGDAQQGTGGAGSGEAASTPRQGGSQPHLGSQAGKAQPAAPGGTALNEGGNATEASARSAGSPVGLEALDNARRDETIELADERTERSPDDRARNIGADTPGDPGAQLSQPEGDGNYQRDGDNEIPLVGNPDTGTDRD